MMIRRLLVVLLAAAAWSCLIPVGTADAGGDARGLCETLCYGGGDSAPAASDMAVYRTLCGEGIAATSSAGTYSAPVSVRTLLHHTRPVWRHAACGFMARAIDSPLTAGRYGLYNHKILFASRSKDHYLRKMCRLVI